MSRPSFRLAPSALLLVSLALVACGDTSEPEPEPTPDDDVPAAATELESQTVSIDRAGGQIRFEDGSILEIPGDAFAESTELVASRWQVPTDSSERTEYRFAPAGLVFAYPATLRLALPSQTADTDGLALGFSPESDGALSSLGRLGETDRVTARIVETGRAAVIPETGTRSVVGVAIQTHLDADGDILHVPGSHLQGALLLVVKDENGARQELSATISERGTFRFEGVPVGDYELHLQRLSALSDQPSKLVIVTDHSTLDLGLASSIRADVQRATEESALKVVVDSPQTPEWDDTLMLTSPGTGDWRQGSWMFPDQGDRYFDTSISQPRLPLLVDARRGDVVTLTRMVKQTSSSGQTYEAAKDRARLHSVVQVDGDETTVVATLEDHAFSRSLSLTVQVQDHLDLVTMEACTSQLSLQIFQLLQPNDSLERSSWGLSGSGPLHLLYDFDPSGAPTQSTGLMSYATDSQHAEDELLGVYAHSAALHQLPGTTSGFPRLCRRVGTEITAEAAPATSLSPLMSAPAELTLNGSSIEGPSQEVRLPAGDLTIGWEAPTLGQAGTYEVSLRRFEVVDGMTRPTSALNFRTHHTSLEVPASTFSVGDNFSVIVTAKFNDQGTPLRTPTLIHQSSTESGLVHVVE